MSTTRYHYSMPFLFPSKQLEINQKDKNNIISEPIWSVSLKCDVLVTIHIFSFQIIILIYFPDMSYRVTAYSTDVETKEKYQDDRNNSVSSVNKHV